MQSVDIPAPGPGEVLLRTQYSCISPGTELRCLAGLQPGLVDPPYIPGYATAGIVELAGDGASLAVGTRVIGGGTIRASVNRSWGGHVEYVLIDANACIPLHPEDDLVVASVARLAGIAYRGVRLAQVQPHETVAVVGLGAIGQGSARLFRATGANVVAIDPVAGRRDTARAAGIPTMTIDEARASLIDAVDVVVDATGNERAFPLAVDLARPPATWGQTAPGSSRIIVQGSYPADLPVPYQDTFRKELSVRFPRDVGREDMQTVMRLHREGTLNLRSLVTDVLPPSEAARAYEALRTRPDAITYAFDWNAPAAA
ncbi:MAG: zinc-binding alcohol dehydrogenase [Fimbriimonadaceae bacterium]|nr:zinc-binding alcohol dehydrogenase [Fimbriimonadaceae bacterium]